VLNVLPDDAEPQDIPLIKVPFWVQIHNLPSGYMSQKVGTTLGNYIGEFLEYDEKNDSLPWQKFMRIRVLVDVRLPLKRYKKIKKGEGDSKLVHFKYERLGTFCYVCGLLGHSESRCPKLFDMTETDGARGWSPELRADTGRRQGIESKWIRHGDDSTWVAPDPVSTHKYGDSSNTGSNENKKDKKGNATQEEKMKQIHLADIFRKPDILFPKSVANDNESKKTSEEMDEDEMDVLIMEGGRKRTRTNNKPKDGNDTIKEGNSKPDDSNNTPHNKSGNYELELPGLG
jgi:hypothetical protein